MPFDVFTNNRSPAEVMPQLHILCCCTPSCFIMFSTQITLGSSVVPGLRSSVSRHFTSPRLVTYHSRCPSMSGTEQMPSSGQSFTRPVGSFSLESCQRNLPSASLKHNSTPRSTDEG